MSTVLKQCCHLPNLSDNHSVDTNSSDEQRQNVAGHLTNNTAAEVNWLLKQLSTLSHCSRPSISMVQFITEESLTAL